jgi:hypothetical protein
MSRSGYSDDYDYEDNLAAGRAEGARAQAFNGRRGQAFLREMLEALDAMPVKELIADDLQTADGRVCAIGAVGAARKVDMSKLNPEDAPKVAKTFGISETLARDIVYENDEANWKAETPAARWQRMRAWIERHIKKDAEPPTPSPAMKL